VLSDQLETRIHIKCIIMYFNNPFPADNFSKYIQKMLFRIMSAYNNNTQFVKTDISIQIDSSSAVFRKIWNTNYRHCKTLLAEARLIMQFLYTKYAVLHAKYTVFINCELTYYYALLIRNNFYSRYFKLIKYKIMETSNNFIFILISAWR
jgi:hypothetical protein